MEQKEHINSRVTQTDEKMGDCDNNNFEETDDKNNHDDNNNNNEGEIGELKTITLKEYLENFDKYMTKSCNKKINLLKKDESKDTHAIVSSQACFLPIEKGKETIFNVALFNYQSTKDNPGVLAIVATSKGTSSQIICGNGDEKLLFNDFGIKADFIGQRLTDNRIERGVKDLNAPMTKQEKQDNCILIIQVPLKQIMTQQRLGIGATDPIEKLQERIEFINFNLADMHEMIDDHACNIEHACVDISYVSKSKPSLISQAAESISSMFTSNSYQMSLRVDEKMDDVEDDNDDGTDGDGDGSDDECNIEPAMVKVSPQTIPECICGLKLKLIGGNININNSDESKKCVQCLQNINNMSWMCPNENKHYLHKNGYYLCNQCGEKKLSFDELKGLTIAKLVRDDKYPIRMTLQYYKSTDNGTINDKIMKQIAKQLKMSQKHSNYIGSLVTENDSQRPTEWVKSNKEKDNSNSSMLGSAWNYVQQSSLYQRFAN